MQVTFNPSLRQRLTSLFKLLVMTALFSGAGIAGISVWQAYGNATRLPVVRRMPPLVRIVSPRPDQAGVTVGLSKQAAPSEAAQPEPADDAAASVPPEDSMQLLQSLARDVAAMGQDMTELKARIDHLAAGQDQIERNLATMRQPAPRLELRSAMAATSAQAPRPRKPVLSVPATAARPRQGTIGPTIGPKP